MMPYNHTKFQVETHQGAGSVGKKVLKIKKKSGKLKPVQGGGGVLEWATTLGQFDMSANAKTKNPIIPSNVSQRGPGMSASAD